MDAQKELNKKITLSETIIGRLDAKELLSDVLSQVRSLMVLSEDAITTALVDILIHGLVNIPYQLPPFVDPIYQEAGLLHMKLCGVENIMQLDIDETIQKAKNGKQSVPQRTHSLISSVYEIENLELPLEPVNGDSYELLNVKFQGKILYQRKKGILQSLRAYIYDCVNKVLLESSREKDRIEIFGAEYRLITDKLDALESPVGEELIAAADNLKSSNPANWSAAALLCRNVIYKLADLLWYGEDQEYMLIQGNSIEITKSKEKNILLAYIDTHFKKDTDAPQAELEEINGLVHSIYDKGSKAKRTIRLKEAQQIVVDTYHFVDLLDRVSGLAPIDKLD